jgi:superfamily II DNA helicase RecQ
VVCTSHEQFYRDDVRKIMQDSRVSKRLGTVIIDEVHLLGDWKSFRPAFKNWQWFRACIPPHVPIAACTATLAMGTPYTAILRALGFREHSVTGPANFKLIKLDTERHNISLHLRQIQHSVSGWKFSDLEWLISERVGDNPSCWPKTIVYCEAIDLGHRVVTALRKILPPALTSRAQDIVRHIHSLRCSSCKAEAVAAFSSPGISASCRIIVATDAFGMGIDIPDIKRVILFRSPRTNCGRRRAECSPDAHATVVTSFHIVGARCVI